MTKAVIKPQPGPQENYLSRKEFEGLYGGAKGGGKTWALTAEPTRWVEHPFFRGIIFRRTTKQLRKVIDQSEEIYPLLNATFNQTKNIWKFPSGAQIILDHLQYEKDKKNHQGIEYHYIAFDELTHFTKTQYEYILTCARSSKKGLTPFVRSAANPGGVGHVWVKKRFIDALKPFETGFFKTVDGQDIRTTKDDKKALSRVFIPAKVYDNKILMERDPNYLRILESLPRKLREALLKGDWSIFEGQFFDEWNEFIHVIPNIEPQSYHNLFICGDYGWGSGKSVIHWAYVDELGKVTFYRELAVEKTHYSDLAAMIYDLTPEYERKRIQYIVFDPAVFGDREHHRGDISGETGAEIMLKVFVDKGWRIPIFRGDNRRIAGWNLFREYLKVLTNEKNEKYSRARWCACCKDAIETIPSLIHNDYNPEDLNSDGEDHAADCDRYGLMSRPQLAIVPVVKEYANVMEQYNDERLKRMVDEIETEKMPNYGLGRIV